MNAFAGVIRLDGGPVDAAQWRAIQSGSRMPLLNWSDGPVGLAGTQLHVEPDLVVVADARLDRRDTLIEVLGLGDPALSDAALIGAAYRRWGVDCVDRLLGDFAFLLWDGRERRLLGVRDHMGVRPFFYFAGSDIFAAGHSIGTVLPAMPDRSIDEGQIADFVAGSFTSRETTFFRDARRLPPGHLLVLSNGDVQIKRYWALDREREVAPSDAAGEFRALLEEAVRCRLPQAGNTGLMLSGGLDSSSIAAVATHMPGIAHPIPALSMTLRHTPNWNDEPHLDAMLASNAFDPTHIPIDDCDPLGDLNAMLDEQREPILGYNNGASRQLYWAARARGLTALLDGHGGDEAVSHGNGRINELARAGHWIEAWREAQGVAGIHHENTWRVFAPYIDHIRVVRATRRRWRRWTRSAPVMRESDRRHILVARDLAARVRLAERQRILAGARGRPAHTSRDLHVELLETPIQAHAFESLAATAAAAGVTPLYPLMDRRLVEFCVALPSREKLYRGLPRYVMRQAMKDLLPEDLRLRKDKFNFLPTLAKGLQPHTPWIGDMIRSDSYGICAYVDRDVATQAVETLSLRGAEAPAVEVMGVWRTAVLGRWLERIVA